MRRLLPLLAFACQPASESDGRHRLPPDAPLPLDPTIEARVDELLGRMSLEQKVAQLHGSSIVPGERGWTSPDDDALGIPGFRWSDGPRGVTSGTGTMFPVATARAATWDPDLEREVGGAIGREAAAKGIDVVLAPVLNPLVHPAYGRAQETYGEDPFLVTRMGVASVEGIQEYALASAKHFAANYVEDTRFDVDVTVDARTLHEVELPAFRAAVRQADVASVMSAYNRVNGAHCTENRPLLTGILRETWGWHGFVVSDWAWAVHDAEAAIEAGNDVEMPVPQHFGDLPALVAKGAVAQATVDEAVRRVLRRKLAYGVGERERPDPAVVGSEAHRALARRVAAEGMVLLKNAGDALPFASDLRVAVVGPYADVPNGGDVGSSDVHAAHVVTPWEGLVAALGADRVTLLDPGALDALGEHDLAVVVVGLDAEDEGENIPGKPGGDRETLALDEAQIALIREVAAAAPVTAVVLLGGSAITVEEWIDDVDVLLLAFYAGQEGGHALADVLFGAAPPAGRLPFTVPTGPEQLPRFDAVSHAIDYPRRHGYRHIDREGHAPRFPFGFGLSTTTFALSALDVDGMLDGPDGALTVRLTVTNTGPRAGAEVVQLYVGPEDETLDLPDRVLADFEKVWLDPGASREVTLTVPATALATWDPDEDAWMLAPGAWTVWVGTSSRDLPLSARFEVR